jgi:hypothetical protein
VVKVVVGSDKKRDLVVGLDCEAEVLSGAQVADGGHEEQVGRGSGESVASLIRIIATAFDEEDQRGESDQKHHKEDDTEGFLEG